jgi:undecaprenyl diphosphate synthase
MVKKREEELLQKIDKNKLPRHIAIIMDGNGRWAREKNLPRIFGHKEGIKAVRRVIKSCVELEIEILTLFAFSTENWKRPLDEINELFHLLELTLKRETKNLIKNNIKFTPIGRLNQLPPNLQNILEKIAKATEANDGLKLNIAINYSGRTEIIDATKRMIKDGVDPNLIEEKTFSKYLYIPSLPDPDLLIRTSGEKRISNFLLWEIAYTEIWFTPIYWPDFKKLDLLEAIIDYQKRRRRFGSIQETEE